ncbi:MAG: hypothetical protein M1822_006612 [Bathelium mastoideum]|nr:MAG: hypothetical protein M1822_006612 [Bathelium mastoideum]
MEDTDAEKENSVHSAATDGQPSASNSVSTAHSAADNFYGDTHALDTLSQAADMAGATFHQSPLELRHTPQSIIGSTHPHDYITPSELSGFGNTFSSAAGQTPSSSANIASNAPNDWSFVDNSLPPWDPMDYELNNIADWTTLDFNYPDPFLFTPNSFDIFSYNNSIPILRQNAGYSKPEGPNFSALGPEQPFGQILNSRSGTSKIFPESRHLPLPSRTAASPVSIQSTPGIPSFLSSSRPPSRREQSKTPTRTALEDAKDEQTLQNNGAWPTNWVPTKRDGLMGFPDMSNTPDDVFEAENFAHVEPLSQDVYQDIVKCFRSVSSDQDLFKKFRESKLPPLAAFDCFIQLYFEFFQPSYPILHQATFIPSNTNFVLILALASIGCRYSRSKEAKGCALPLVELTRRAVVQAIEADNSIARQTWLTLAQLLNNFSMLYSGDKRFLEVAQAHWGALLVQTRRNRSLKEPVRPMILDLAPLSGAALEAKWMQWRDEETRTRLGYLVWGLDSQLAMSFDISSSMALTELQRKLPVREDIWEATTAEAWKPLYLKYQGQVPDIHTALCDLKDNHHISPAIGDLARILITQAIFFTGWNLRCVFKNPLLTALDESPRRWKLQDQWRQMLDQLAAHPMLADESSSMAATVRCQTHHVTLLIYAPLTELLAFAGAEVGSASDRRDVLQAKLLAWLREDEGRAARRAVLHAAVLFTFVRLRSKAAFFEPFALLLATLTLWVYVQLRSALDAEGEGSAHQQQQPQQQHQPEQQRKTVRLDKPKDEQAVRLWVEEGAELRGHISDVGNITAPGGGQRLLQVACRTLMGLESWPLSQGFARVLTILGGKSGLGDKHG